MKDYLISQFIDDELSLEEKREFVTEVKKDDEFYGETVSFLDTEIKLHSTIRKNVLPPDIKVKKTDRTIYRYLSAAIILISVVFFIYQLNFKTGTNTAVDKVKLMNKEYRFVLYSDNSKDVEIMGSFTNWKRVKLNRIGQTGYWEIRLPITHGEHKYSFIVDGNIMSDPTSTLCEEDGFGNVNSILEI